MQMYIHYAHICTHILTYTYTYMPIYSLLSYRLFLWAQSECYKLQTILFLLISFSTAFGSPSSYICSRHNEQCCDVWTLFCHLSGLGMTGCTHSCPQTQYCFHLPIDVTCTLRTVAVPLLRIQRAGLLSLPGGTAQAHIVLWLFLQDSTGWAQAQGRVWSQVICGALSLQQPCYHCVLCFQNPAK